MTTGAEPPVAGRLRQLADQLSVARQMAPSAADPGRLASLLQSLAGELQGLRADDARACRAELIAVLDEAEALHGVLQREWADLAAQLDLGGRHRRAGVAYRRAAGT